MSSRKADPPQAFPATNSLPTDKVKPVDEPVELRDDVAADPATVRRKMIAEAAYYRAKQRGFSFGHELEDWLAAENEIVKSWLERTPSSMDR